MVLTIDVGNTSIHAGIYKSDRLLSSTRINTSKNKDKNNYQELLSRFINSEKLIDTSFDGCIIACVVPSVLNSIVSAVESLLSISSIVVDSSLDIGMPILLDDPSELGADRLVNGFSAYKKFNQSAIVVDFGTATTLDCISNRGEYLGGVITPGMKISSEALFEKTSKLPRVEPIKPKNIIGKNTVECIQSGIINGYVALVDGLIDGIKEEMDSDPKVVSTGGFSKVISEYSRNILYVDEMLTLRGLNLIYNMNV